MTSHGEAKQYPNNPGVILLVKKKIPWTHEIGWSGKHLEGGLQSGR
jgi:hypothetical protein